MAPVQKVSQLVSVTIATALGSRLTLHAGEVFQMAIALVDRIVAIRSIEAALVRNAASNGIGRLNIFNHRIVSVGDLVFK